MAVRVTRMPLNLRPDRRRVITRYFGLGDENRVRRIIDRALAPGVILLRIPETAVYRPDLLGPTVVGERCVSKPPAGASVVRSVWDLHLAGLMVGHRADPPLRRLATVNTLS